MDRVLRHYGGVVKLAARFERAPGTVSAWERVPAELVEDIAAETGIERHVLRPDLGEGAA